MAEASENNDANGDVRGYCPMGCGRTLFVASGGWITCSYADCPDPTRLADILSENQPYHVVTFTDAGWTIRHPLSERWPPAALEDCSLHKHCERLDGPPVKPGRYVAFIHDDHWHFRSAPSGANDADQ